MHKSHEAPRRPWLIPLLVFSVVLVGMCAWLWISVLAPPKLEPDEIAFGRDAYAVQAAGMAAAVTPPLLAEVPAELADGETYRASASDAVLLLGMQPVKDTDTQREFQRTYDAIVGEGGAVVATKPIETPVGPGMQIAWVDAGGARHATVLTVHKSRRVILQTSSAQSDPTSMLEPILLSMRETGHDPISIPALGLPFWLAVGVAVCGAAALGALFARRGRSVAGGIALGAGIGVVVGIAAGILI